MRIDFAQSARTHRIGRARVRQVIEAPVAELRLPGGEGFDDRLAFLGDDTTGRALEVMAVPLIDGLLVIHAMDPRAKWRPQYEDGKR